MKSSVSVLAVVIALAMLISPLFMGQADSVTESDVEIFIQGLDVDPTTSEVTVLIENGKTETLTFFIVNKSENRLSAYIESVSSSNGMVTVKQTGSTPIVIEPYRSDSSQDISYLQATVETHKFTDSGNYVMTVNIHLQDFDDGTFAAVPTNLTVKVVSSYDISDGYNKFFGLIDNDFDGIMGEPGFTAIVSVVLTVIIVMIIALILIPIVFRLAKIDKRNTTYQKTKRNIEVMALVMAAILSLNETVIIVSTDKTVLHLLASLSYVLIVLTASALAWVIYKAIIINLLGTIEKNVDTGDSSLIPLFKMLGRIVICVAAVAAILSFFGVDLAGILVSAGVVSLGITLGAQNVLNQFFSGIVILATRPFKKGDFVKINGEVYIVQRVRLMQTEFTNWSKDQIVTIPNNVVASSTLVNLTRGSTTARITVFVSVAYGADLKKAKEILLKAAEMHPQVIKDGSVSMPSTTMTDWEDSGIQYRLACFVDHFDNSAAIAGELRESIYQMFEENGIEIPYSRVQVDILSAPDN
jgi:small-conductance mechanosensitive channel